MDLRVEYAHWCLDWISKGALFVFTDETYISAGGRPHKRRKVTIVEGQAPETRASWTDPIYFKVMQWGAICEDTRVAPPYLLWEWETPEEKQLHQAELDRENLKLQQDKKKAQAAAEVDGTIERRVLGLINANIDLANEARRRQGHQKGMKRHRKPAQVFAHKPLVRGEKSKGIDWFLYRKFVLHERLFPYIRELQKLNPDRTIVVVEDGASLHVKAGNICEAEYAAIGCVRAPHTSNSPDLNQIEPIWDYEKDQLDGRFQRSASKDAVTEGRALIADEWSRIRPKARQLCLSFEAKLRKVIELNGNNNYRG
jgi:hypothetical protein